MKPKNTNLPALPASERVRALAVLAHGDARMAETALCELAEAEGDNAVADLMEASSPLDLAAIFAEHDATSQTIMAYCATPEQVVKVLAMEPARWEKIVSKARGWNDVDDWGKVAQIKNSAFHLMVSLLFGRTDDERAEIIEAIWEDEEARLFLLFCLIDLDDDNFPDEIGDVQDNNTNMLYWWIKDAVPELVPSILRAFSLSGQGSIQAINNLRAMAIDRIRESEGDARPDKKVADDMFTPLE